MTIDSIDHTHIEDDDEPDGKTRWAILVDTTGKGWIITRISPDIEVGEYESDLCQKGQDYMVGAFFDENVERLLQAITVLGGDSIEGTSNILDLLSGVCRSFVEAQYNLKKSSAL